MSEFSNPPARPATVLHVLNSASGGAALSTRGLVERLAAAGIRSCAVCNASGTREERERMQEAFDGAIEFTPLYWWNRKIRSPLWKRPVAEARQILATGWALGSAARVAAAATRWNADLIHTNTLVTPEGALAARRLGLPHVWHLRELVGPGQPYQFRLHGQRLGRYLEKYCSKLVANSEASAALVRSWLPPGLLELVPNGIDINRFTPREPQAQAGRTVVAMVGHLTSRAKKHALFIDAASRVDRALDVEWRIYGHDPSRGGTVRGDAYADGLHEAVARAGLRDRFQFPGFVEDPAAIMREVDVVVHPADNESFGRVIVEAMAAALPAIGVRGGGVGGTVEHGVTGLLAEHDDPADLARCIEQLVRDRSRREAMGRAGRQRAMAHYSLEACAAGVIRVYEQAMARPLGPPALPIRAPAPTVALAGEADRVS